MKSYLSGLPPPQISSARELQVIDVFLEEGRGLSPGEDRINEGDILF